MRFHPCRPCASIDLGQGPGRLLSLGAWEEKGSSQSTRGSEDFPAHHVSGGTRDHARKIKALFG
jgi:hypothetical protein